MQKTQKCKKHRVGTRLERFIAEWLEKVELDFDNPFQTWIWFRKILRKLIESFGFWFICT